MSKRGLLIGSILADAFSLGGHWIYDVEKLKEEFGEYNDLHDPLPESFHKKRKKGEHTHYGDQTLLLLEHLAENGDFQKNNFKQFWFERMKNYDGYMDNATKESIENIEQGKEWGSSSKELGGASRIAPIVYCFDTEEDKAVEYARVQTKITHDNEKAIQVAEFFTRTAFRVLEGESPSKALEKTAVFMNDSWIQGKFQEAKGHLEFTPVEAIKGIGQSCSVEVAFTATIYLILKYEDNYERAMIGNVMAGGDSAARGLLAGMIIGAYSEKSIPKKWLGEMCSLERVNF